MSRNSWYICLGKLSNILDIVHYWTACAAVVRVCALIGAYTLDGGIKNHLISPCILSVCLPACLPACILACLYYK